MGTILSWQNRPNISLHVEYILCQSLCLLRQLLTFAMFQIIKQSPASRRNELRFVLFVHSEDVPDTLMMKQTGY